MCSQITYFDPNVAQGKNHTLEIINPKHVHSGQEDCLYLNVFVPLDDSEKPPKNMPVMVWIYGGSFTAGSATFDEYGPTKFLDFNNVIMVNISKLV